MPTYEERPTGSGPNPVPGGSVLVGSQRPSARPLPRFGLIPVMTGTPLEALQTSYMPFGCGTEMRMRGFGCSHRRLDSTLGS